MGAYTDMNTQKFQCIYTNLFLIYTSSIHACLTGVSSYLHIYVPIFSVFCNVLIRLKHLKQIIKLTILCRLMSIKLTIWSFNDYQINHMSFDYYQIIHMVVSCFFRL